MGLMAPKLSRTHEEEKTAYHEAGHVVAAFEMGISVRYVTIRPHGKGLMGNTVLRPTRFTPGVGGHLIIELAGASAAQLFRPDACPEDDDQVPDAIDRAGIRDDLEQVLDAANLLFNTDEEKQDYLKKMIDRTDKLVESNWCQEAIQDIAEALLEKNTLTGREAKEIYFRAKTCSMAIRKRSHREC